MFSRFWPCTVLLAATSILPGHSPAQDSTPAFPPRTLSSTSPQTDTADRPNGLPQAEPESSPASAAHKEDTHKDQTSRDNDQPLRPDQTHNANLWHDPGNIAALDLYHGQGGEKHQPAPPFTFESEDHNGTNPKFDVRDANDHKWRVKLGVEARPEVVASRLLWAAGYNVNDDYVLTDAVIPGLHLSRGQNEVRGGHVSEARFARKPSGQKKIGTWAWKQNPFTGTRELNGLRVVMAVMNNWDLKDENNAVYSGSDSGQQIFLVSDVGASFGTNGLSWTHARSKGNVDSFRESKFITRSTETEVDFATPKAPTARLLETAGFGAKEFADRHSMEWIGHNIPRHDAQWIGSLLGQLSRQQLSDAFRAGHFPPDQIDAYVELIENRIHELQGL